MTRLKMSSEEREKEREGGKLIRDLGQAPRGMQNGKLWLGHRCCCCSAVCSMEDIIAHTQSFLAVSSSSAGVVVAGRLCAELFQAISCRLCYVAIKTYTIFCQQLVHHHGRSFVLGPSSSSGRGATAVAALPVCQKERE